MNIKTKAEPGQEIFYLLKSSVCSSNVQCVNIHAYVEGSAMGMPRTGISVKYKTSHGEINEEGIYLSKEDLANAILEGKL